MGKTAVGLYESSTDAAQVVNDLVQAGFNRSDIRLMLGDNTSRQIREWREGDSGQRAAGDSQWAGGGATSMLIASGVPRSDANYYEEALHRGNALVSVATTDQRIDQAVEIMSHFDMVDLGDRVDRWRKEGWQEASGTAGIPSTMRRDQALRTGEEESIPIVEEELQVGKRQVERGGVRVRAHVTETPVEETVTLRDEHVTVERQPVNRPASAADLDTFQEKTLEFTETDEEAIVSKQARVVEEVKVRKDVEEHQETIRDSVRRTDVDVEQLGDWDRYRNEFRTHYDKNYATSGFAYTDYEPAYQYGYRLGARQDLRGQNWSQIEPVARRQWESENRGPWDRFKDAVQHSWQRATR